MFTIALVVAAGAAIAGVHALGGLMLTPFFGSSPLLWSMAIASFPVSLSLGILLGAPFGRAKAGGAVWAHRLGVLAGVMAFSQPLALAPVARAVLDPNPDAAVAPVLAVFLLVTLPAAVAAMVLPSVETSTQGGGALRKLLLGSRSGPLLLLALGATAGIAVSAPSLMEPAEMAPWQFLWGLGGALLVTGALRVGMLSRVVMVLAVGAAAGTLLTTKSEVRAYEYSKALRQAWDLRVGRYYLDTAGRRVLARTEVHERYEALRKEIGDAESKPVAAVLVVETLKNMGAVQLSGDGLWELLNLHLPDGAKRHVMPLVDRIAAVRSDGRGQIDVSLRREPDEDAIRVTIPAGEDPITFVFTADFSLAIHVERSEAETRTSMDVGPVTVERAGFFEANDTITTPVMVEDVAFFVDAYLHGFKVITRPDRVIVMVRGQGSVGEAKETVLQEVELGDGE